MIKYLASMEYFCLMMNLTWTGIFIAWIGILTIGLILLAIIIWMLIKQ